MRRSIILQVRALSQQPLVASFQLTPLEAKEKFLDWQKRHPIAATGILGDDHTITPVLLPFWLFNLTTQIDYTAKLGVKTSDGSINWKSISSSKHDVPDETYSPTDLGMQIFAAYSHRRDYAEAIKLPNLQPHLRPLTTSELSTATCNDTQLGPLPLHHPGMRQSIAWEFALRAVRQAEGKAIENKLLELNPSGSQVSELFVKLNPLSRRAYLAYIPAYCLQYTYGETFNVHGERMPQQFISLISGFKEGGLAATRHLSARKAGVIAGGGVAVVATAVHAALGTPIQQLLDVEGVFLTFIIGSSAALATRIFPLLVEQRAEEKRIAAETADIDRIISLGLGPMDAGSDDQDVIRSDAEWRRWESADLDDWNEEKRKQWAENLWRSQHQRRAERALLKKKLELNIAQRQEEEAREHRRRKKWGRSSHFHHFRHQQDAFTAGMRSGVSRDPLGYYKVLGLDMTAKEDITQATIKKAFRKLALRWHPDRHSEESKQRRAKDTFYLISTAYETLSDPKQREKYDRGELIKPL